MIAYLTLGSKQDRACELDLLFNDAHTCRTLFRSFTPVQQQLLLRLLPLEIVPQSIISNWSGSWESTAKSSTFGTETVADAIKALRSFRILQSDAKKSELVLNPTFAQTLRHSLLLSSPVGSTETNIFSLIVSLYPYE